ncbi:LAME_0D06128g1_1 [Lachancea meyersii CBS 8951]|uniref:LAME_0D06128g1_1 n=1 Tax=Lachancea meyersii CBS 8951 TaxID=1266667 RepID=A0A1G4J9L5_9SACH|nr:LAME_0D06128g1_1 [Lachancea meyersii CBS 8951]
MAIDEQLGESDGANLVVCYSSHERGISKTMADFLAPKNANDSAAATRTLYFVDAMDRFPVKEFCEFLPPEEHHTLFENVRILTSLDMDEFSRTVGQISRSTLALRSAHQRSPQDVPVPEVLVFVRGLDVIFRNTALKDQMHAHRSLKDAMLRLRMLGNAREFPTRTIVLFPSQGQGPSPNTQNVVQPSQKRQKKLGNGAFQNYNSLAGYLTKFYADSVISEPCC